MAEFFAIITDSRKVEVPWSPAQAKNYINDLLESVQEVHFLDMDILNAAYGDIVACDIKRYNIFDHLIAHSMNSFGIEAIVTLNRKDFRKYDFIKEIISPEQNSQ